MSSTAKSIPHRPAITPYLTVRNAAAAIDFYKKVFGAVEQARMAQPDGRIGHAEIQIGNSWIMLSDEFPEYEAVSPETIGGSPVTIHMYVDDVDAVFALALANGATTNRPPADQFYGDRAGRLKDPFGHSWYLATRKETLSWDEIKRRAEKLHGKSGG